MPEPDDGAVPEPDDGVAGSSATARALRRADAAVVAWNDRVERFGRWRRELVDELAVLPGTLRRFREGVGNFSLVAERVAAATEGLERAQRAVEATGVTDAARRLDEAAAAVGRQVAAVREGTPGLEMVEAAVEEFNRTVAGVAERFPGWRGALPSWPAPGRRR